MIKVRFHLAKGENFKKWQVRRKDEVYYYDPDTVNLVMTNCKLKNQKATAQKIHDGANKSVCAWIECDEVEVLAGSYPRPDEFYFYNPKHLPHWYNQKGDNVDNQKDEKLWTVGRLVVKPLSK